jgi:hypothetical protein
MKKNIVVCILMILAGIVNAQKYIQIELPKWIPDTVYGPPKGAILGTFEEVLDRVMELTGMDTILIYQPESRYIPSYSITTGQTVYIYITDNDNRQSPGYSNDGYDPTLGRYENRYYNANPGLLMPLPAPPPLPRSVPYYYIPKK